MSSQVDMSKHTDAKGIVHTVHPDFLEGDIVLLSNDSPAFRFSKSRLADVSSVFRDMFAGPSLTGSEVGLGVTGRALGIFLTFVRDPQTRLSEIWDYIVEAVNFAKQYDCNALAGDILYEGCRDDPEVDRLAALAEASKISHHLAACRIIRHGIHGEISGQSLRPNSGEWSARDAARLSPAWVWALTCAVQAADKQINDLSRRETDEYWVLVMGEFMNFLTSTPPE